MIHIVYAYAICFATYKGVVCIHKFVVGIMGGGDEASTTECNMAYHLGGLIAKEGWVLLNGGRAAGVMDASARGAKDSGGLTVGIIPDRDNALTSQYIDIPIFTGMGVGRNFLNVLSSNVVVALPGKAGTISEIALALKIKKQVILLGFDLDGIFSTYRKAGLLKIADSPEEVMQIIREGREP